MIRRAILQAAPPVVQQDAIWIQYNPEKNHYRLYIPQGIVWRELRLEGFIGDPGKSAYDIAVENGFVGTEQEWLESLQASVTRDGIIAALGYPPGKITTKTKAEWERERNYIPDKGEIVVYSDYETTIVDGHQVEIPRIKIGSGNAYVSDLVFVGGEDSSLLLQHISNTDIHTSAAEKDFWNNKLNVDDNAEVVDEILIFNRN